MNICTDASTLIVMASDRSAPTPPPGGAFYALTDQQSATLIGLQAQPNGGINFDGTTFTVLPFVPPPVIDPSNSDNLSKTLKAILLAAAGMSGKTPAQAKAAFLAAWQALP